MPIHPTTLGFLQNLVGPDRVSVRGADLEAHSHDESFHGPYLPEVVVWPQNAAEISAILRHANEHRIPVTPWCGGSSLEGNPLPVCGGILLDVYRMNQILEVREADLQVVVQPGIVYDELNKRLARYGLFFPPAPGSSDVATIGGMVANNSSGMHAVKYGATKDYVQQLEVVLPDGEIIRCGRPVLKSASGYDLCRLIIGSEGTLGVVTEITLRLRIRPEAVAAVAVFPTMEAAAEAIYRINRYGPMPAALELMDPTIIEIVNAWTHSSLVAAPTLVIEFHGVPAGIEQELELSEETCRDAGCTSFERGIAIAEREKLWHARKQAHEAVKQLNAGCRTEIGDIVVPISRYTEAVAQAYRLASELNVRIATFGHAGDGNLHVEMLSGLNDRQELERAHEFNRRLVTWVLSVGGTCTGEHGVGIGKREFMQAEHGASLALMKRIKGLLDPNGIMNPGKLFPDP
ncbi:MAG: putative FAD-linked oxidoreductase [Chloroflexi bacterium ADurb.Bin180]|nr:MAG: putative FAD-linked oxidoreductase [Chloroflexi bacterium ADurb.Bin180]HNR95647.1 FAD-binding oxidoreductase [Anaerolineae bacterium]HNT05247.1 FAD-binding oxidoreductase [Anaerolineae bacterium]